MAQLGIGEGKEGEVGRARECRYRLEGASISDSFTLGVSIFDNLGIDDVAGTDIKPVPSVGKHEAVQSIGDAGGCAITMAVTDSSRVDTRVLGDTTKQQKACELALQLAKLVEPELP